MTRDGRPVRVAILLGLLAQALFAFRLSQPAVLVFDEVHYVPAARALLALAGPANIEHPLLGKAFIALGIALFGDTPFGWRVFSSVAASAVVIGVFAIGWLNFGRMRPAVVAALLVLLDGTLLVQARIAMLDGFMAAFVVWGIAAMLWAMRATGPRVSRRLVIAGVCLGLAAGAKWAAVPYLGFAALAFALVRDERHWPGVSVMRGGLLLGGSAVAAYFLTFLPAFFYAREPLTLATLLPFQAEMYARQTMKLPAHGYQSDWWSWALMLRPMWYFWEPVAGVWRGVLLVGNPVVMWGGLVAVGACLWARSLRLGAIAGLWLGSYLVWGVIPKSLGFYYYYYLSSLFLPLAMAGALDRARRGWDMAVVTAALAMAVYFYPIWAGAALSGPGAFHRWMWFENWI